MGNGSYKLQLNEDQLVLITALMYNCRLGQNTYASAAYEILEMIETLQGTDWMHIAADTVNLHVTVEDHHGDVVFSSIPGIHDVTLEV